MLPVIVAGACALFLVPLLFVRELGPVVRAPGTDGSRTAGLLAMNVYLQTYLFPLLVVPLFSTWILGCGLRRPNTKREDRSLHLFLATRPLQPAALIGARLLAAARSVALAWTILLGTLLIAALFPAQSGERSGPLILLLPGRFEWKRALAALLLGWTWRNLVLGSFAELLGRAWLVYGYVALTGGAPFVLLPFVRANEWPIVEPFLKELVFALLALKIVGACVVIPLVLRNPILRVRTIAVCITVWCAVMAGIALSMHLLWPDLCHILSLLGLGPVGDLLTPPAALFLIAIALPFNRLLAAPLALQANRVR